MFRVVFIFLFTCQVCEQEKKDCRINLVFKNAPVSLRTIFHIWDNFFCFYQKLIQKRRANMYSDSYVMLILWIVLPFILWKVTPRNRLREVIATLLFFQMLTWLFSIFLTYFGLYEPPFRLFKNATKINWTMEYLVFPFFSVLFQLKFPKNEYFFRRLSHYLFWVGMILLAMILLGKISNIVNSNMESLIRSFFNFIMVMPSVYLVVYGPSRF
ncbi:CBO0543 family protein [Neobacillus cucumis]|uniref:CBO0543 family protein n=1 Tax=Neobacillus cucumis TaxID=1740721 RepID=UPI00399C795E